MTNATPPSSPRDVPLDKPQDSSNKPLQDEPLQELSGTLLDEQNLLTIVEISRVCAVQTEYIVELVDEGLIAPEKLPETSMGDDEPHAWRFTGTHMRQARIAAHLQSDLGVNAAGVALALQLLDEVEALRAQLEAMEMMGGR